MHICFSKYTLSVANSSALDSHFGFLVITKAENIALLSSENNDELLGAWPDQRKV